LSSFAKVIGVLLSSLCGLAAAAAPDEGVVEVIIADELRTAFFEHAPRRLASSMSKAVTLWCSTPPPRTSASSDEDDPLKWLCQGKKPEYFRNVYVNGQRGRHGLVCKSNGTSSLRYFGVDLVASVLEDESCVAAEYDGEEYTLYFKDGGREGDS
jgi:hypothetical protein